MVPISFLFCFFPALCLSFALSSSFFPFCSFSVIEHLGSRNAQNSECTHSLGQIRVWINTSYCLRCSSPPPSWMPWELAKSPFLQGSLLPHSEAWAPSPKFLPLSPTLVKIFFPNNVTYLPMRSSGASCEVNKSPSPRMGFFGFVLPLSLSSTISIPLISKWKTKFKEPEPMAHGERLGG